MILAKKVILHVSSDYLNTDYFLVICAVREKIGKKSYFFTCFFRVFEYRLLPSYVCSERKNHKEVIIYFYQNANIIS